MVRRGGGGGGEGAEGGRRVVAGGELGIGGEERGDGDLGGGAQGGEDGELGGGVEVGRARPPVEIAVTAGAGPGASWSRGARCTQSASASFLPPAAAARRGPRAGVWGGRG